MIKKTIKYNGSEKYMFILNRYRDKECSIMLRCGIKKTGVLHCVARIDTFLDVTEEHTGEIGSLCIDNFDINYMIIFDDAIKIKYENFKPFQQPR